MIKMHRLLPFLLMGLVAIGCSRTVYVPLQRPAAVFVSPHIQRVALLDRSEINVRNVNRIESVITGEFPGLDREGAQMALDGLARSLQDNQRYQIARVDEQWKSPVAIPGQWPPLLEWSEVELLCNKYNANALLVLESYDSDFIVTNGSRVVRRKDKDGKEVATNEFYAKGIATVSLGFRFYDPANRTVIDEHMYVHSRTWENSGNLLQMALTNLIDHSQAVREVSHQAGMMYSSRISPHWYRVSRSFLTRGRGDANFNIGVRRATVNDWTGAMEAWYMSANSSKRKTAGRSYFNLALMYEIQGDLQTAFHYAQRSYTDYRIKQGRSYSNILRKRIRDAVHLE